MGWDDPEPLTGSADGVVGHGDVTGIEGVRRSLGDWLDARGRVDAGPASRLEAAAADVTRRRFRRGP